MQCLGKVVDAPAVVPRLVPDGPDIAHRQRQCHVHGSFCWLFASLAVFSSFVGKTVMSRITVGWVDVNGALWRNLGEVNPDPEVDAFRGGNLDFISNRSIWQ